MRVFVTGATGFVGAAVVRELLDAGHQVIGLARSDDGERSLRAAGARVHRGDLGDAESLRAGVAAAEGVIHTAFNHDFSKFRESSEQDRRVIEALGSALAGSERPLVVASPIGILPPGRVIGEDTRPAPGAGASPRVATEEAVDGVAGRGVHATIVRLPPSTHGEGDHAFVPTLIRIARETGTSAYVGDGSNRWPAVHRLDAARLFRLALERGRRGARYHAVAEEGVPFREIAEVIGRRLHLPVTGKPRDEGAAHFGWFAHFAGLDVPASSQRTREELGWTPEQPGLIADLEGPAYFAAGGSASQVHAVRAAPSPARPLHLQRADTKMDDSRLGGRFTFPGTELTVHRVGYGAMQLAGPNAFGPPADPEAAVAVLREAVEAGVDHIDTSDFYGPHVTNQTIRRALHPYPDGLVIVTKVSARRGADGAWIPAFSREELTAAVHDNLRNLGVDVLDVVNLRSMHGVHAPSEGSIEAPLSVLADLQRQGLIRHIGLSNVTAAQVAEARAMVDIVCVQNRYNLVFRDDEALIDTLAQDGIAYVPWFPLGGFSPLQSAELSDIARRLEASPMQVALAWLLHRAPNILLIPGTSSVAHLRQNLQAGQLQLAPDVLAELDAIAAEVSPEH